MPKPDKALDSEWRARWAEIARSATQGEWVARVQEIDELHWGLVVACTLRTQRGQIYVMGNEWAPEFAHMAASCPQNVLALLAYVQELEQELEAR